MALGEEEANSNDKYAFPSGSTMSMSQLSPTQPQSTMEHQARAAFSTAGKDQNSYITFEFLESLRQLRMSIPYHGALDGFSKLGTDKDGHIVETEYVYAYLQGNFTRPNVP